MAGTTALTTEISDALSRGKQGCPLCSLWLQEDASVMERLRTQDASKNTALAEALRVSSGFCNKHTHAAHRKGSDDENNPLACSVCARVVLKKFAEGLAPILVELQTAKMHPEAERVKGEEPLGQTTKKLEDLISGGATICPICEQLLESDEDRMANLIQMLQNKDYSELYASSDAMCMPHFVSTVQLLARSSIKDVEGVWGLLMRTQLSRLGSVDHLLNERMRKYSWDYRNEGVTPEETNAQKTAMLVIAGVEGLYGRPRKTSLRPARVWY